MVTTSIRRSISQIEYAQMEVVGVFHAGEATALVDGVIMLQPPGGMPHPYRFTIAQYDLLGESGILDEDARVELIGGEIVAMSPIGRRHARCVDQLTL